jgi:MFS family permease
VNGNGRNDCGIGANSVWPLRKAQTAIIIAGCLGTAFLQIVTSAAAVQYTRALGGTGLHVGVFNALPTGMLFMQLLAGLAANRLRYRRPLWFGLSLIQRTLLVPVALAPVFWPEAFHTSWVWVFLGANIALHGLAQFGSPLWMSWMGDYLPREGLSDFWGIRQRWMNWTISASLATCAVYVLFSGLTIQESYTHLCVLASIVGVIDLILFLKIEEPPVNRASQATWKQVLLEPFKNSAFRSFIKYACMWHFAAMIGAPFISLYLLQHIGMSLFQVLMLWSVSAIGGALSAAALGRFAEKHGNKPLLTYCTLFKPLNMIVLLLAPRDPNLAFLFLAPAFMLDHALNIGIQIGQEGFLLKQSPSRNRAMFIASGMAMAGLVGCATSIGCGALLSSLQGWTTNVGVFSVNGFHLLFWASACMRMATLRFVSRIEEPTAADHRMLAIQIIRRQSIRMSAGRRRKASLRASRLITSAAAADRAA